MAEPRGNIVLVEDDEGKRYVLARYLRSAGHTVTECASGGEGLAAVREETDLVVLDVNLPDMSGHEVCRRIKEDPRTTNTMVLELSASYRTGADRAHGLREGADAYLVHPIEADELLAGVQALLRLRLAEREQSRLRRRLEQSEALHRTVTRSMTAGLVLFRSDGACSFMNPAARELLAPAHDDAVTELFAALPSCAPMPGADPTGEFEWKRGAQILQVRWSLVAEEVEMTILVELKDVTQARTVEAERELFLGVLGHDLRNPLNTIGLVANLLESTTLDPGRVGGYAQRIDANVRKMAALIDALLEFARARSEGFQVVGAPCDLRDVAQAAIRGVEVTHPTVQVQMRVDGDVAGVWDADRLEQVFANLLGNACEHGDTSHPVEIEIRDLGERVAFRVCNWGPPIPETAQRHLFEPFRRASQRRGGLGLGLHIVHLIVTAHGGTIEVRSSEQEGTAFLVQLPRTIAQGA